jgi:hypothetical protein
VKKKPDLLKDVADEVTAEKCIHPNLKFGRYGAELKCIDCEKRWFVCVKGFELPDFRYGNPKIGEGETRHSRFEEQRTQKRKK